MEFNQVRVKNEPVFDHIYFFRQDKNIGHYESESTMKGSSGDSIWDKMFEEEFLKLIKNEPKDVISNTNPIVSQSGLNNPPSPETNNNRTINRDSNKILK